MTDTLSILRQAGFFKNYSSLSNSEILAEIHKKRKKEYSEIFGYDYEPGALDDHGLALQDSTKMFNLDLEADVCQENKSYSHLLKVLSNVSGKDNLITDISEYWQSDIGPITISFKINGNIKQYSPEYSDDWLDGNIIELVLKDISEQIKENFQLCLGPNSEWFGQDVNYIRLSKEERELLEKNLQWVFYDTFLKQMDQSRK